MRNAQRSDVQSQRRSVARTHRADHLCSLPLDENVQSLLGPTFAECMMLFALSLFVQT